MKLPPCPPPRYLAGLAYKQIEMYSVHGESRSSAPRGCQTSFILPTQNASKLQVPQSRPRYSAAIYVLAPLNPGSERGDLHVDGARASLNTTTAAVPESLRWPRTRKIVRISQNLDSEWMSIFHLLARNLRLNDSSKLKYFYFNQHAHTVISNEIIKTFNCNIFLNFF